MQINLASHRPPTSLRRSGALRLLMTENDSWQARYRKPHCRRSCRDLRKIAIIFDINMSLWYEFIKQVKNIGVGIMSKRIRIDIPKEPLAQFCETYHVRRFSLYGSALRDDFGPDSDIDIFKIGSLSQNLFFEIFGKFVVVHFASQ